VNAALLRVGVAFITGAAAGAIFWALRVPAPVPPLFGLIGLLAIAGGEAGTSWLIALVRSRERCRSRSQHDQHR
jgi:XapX domain-containing protein